MNNKKNKMPNAKCQKGITLIALIITIIVLLILAGTAISIAINGGDIFSKAAEARNQWNSAVATEEQKVNEVWNILNTMTGGTNPAPTLPAAWGATAGTYVAEAYTDGTADTRQVPIPKGFVASSATGESTIATGLVIYKGTEAVTDSNVATAKTTRDQYVWIPVTNTSTWTDSYSTGDDMTEPKLLSEVYDERESATLLGYMQSDYTAMKNSVSTYGGFYISRYELNANGGSKKGQDVANASMETSSAWYGLYSLARQDVTDGTNTVLKGHMIFGSEYDQVISFIGTEAAQPHESETGQIPTTPQQSGQTLDVMKNIHDLEGNLFEWTAQAYSTFSRVIRGGYCNDAPDSNFYTASIPNSSDDPTNTYSIYGVRQSLYVAL